MEACFVRQTIDLGGETQKADADVNLFAQSYTANRLVLWVGKFAIVEPHSLPPLRLRIRLFTLNRD